jgi:hypothetical protein
MIRLKTQLPNKIRVFDAKFFKDWLWDIEYYGSGYRYISDVPVVRIGIKKLKIDKDTKKKFNDGHRDTVLIDYVAKIIFQNENYSETRICDCWYVFTRKEIEQRIKNYEFIRSGRAELTEMEIDEINELREEKGKKPI